MGETIAQLFPLMLSAAMAPAPAIVVLLLLRGDGGLATAAAFVAGITLVRLAQGALFGVVFADALSSGGSEAMGTAAATLLLVLGILLWITAIRTLLKTDDPDEPPPAWMARLRQASPLAAFAIGAALITIAAKQWVFTLGALGIIGEQTLGRRDAWVAYLLFVLGAELLLLLPLAVSALAHERSDDLLERVAAWLERNTRPIKITVSIVFGSYFLWKGITGLLG
jgi:hypothetical protein